MGILPNTYDWRRRLQGGLWCLFKGHVWVEDCCARCWKERKKTC